MYMNLNNKSFLEKKYISCQLKTCFQLAFKNFYGINTSDVAWQLVPELRPAIISALSSDLFILLQLGICNDR